MSVLVRKWFTSAVAPIFFPPVLLRQSSCAFWMVKTISTTGTLAMENSVKEEGVGAEASQCLPWKGFYWKKTNVGARFT